MVSVLRASRRYSGGNVRVDVQSSATRPERTGCHALHRATLSDGVCGFRVLEKRHLGRILYDQLGRCDTALSTLTEGPL